MNRAVMSARAAQNFGLPRINRSSTLLKPEPGQRVGYVGRARKAPRLTGTQRNSQGRVSEWSRSPYYRTAVTVDVRWAG